MKIEWIVGFWEGEGSLYNYYKNHRYQLAMSFSQSGKEGRALLVKVKKFLGGVGGEVNSEKSKKARRRTKPGYTYYIHGVEAVEVMKKFMPFFESSYRKRQVKRCLKKFSGQCSRSSESVSEVAKDHDD